jgi:hypothetical protein
MSVVVLPDLLDDLEDEMARHPQVKLEVEEWFADGLYARAIFIPAGTVATGRKHKQGQISILIKGDVTMVGEGDDQRIKAPKVTVSEAGLRRAAFAHEDAILVTVHATDCKDSAKITEALTEPARPHIEKLRLETGQGEPNELLPDYGGA